jgi:antirestriction factor ArdC-like protein
MEARPTVATHHPQGNTLQLRQEALTRAVSGQSLGNFPAIFQGFAAKGIPESEIKPRENVFTYQAWKALGRQVRRGEHGVKVVTFIDCQTKETDRDTGERKSFRRPWTTTVFHVSQTDPLIGGGQ